MKARRHDATLPSWRAYARSDGLTPPFYQALRVVWIGAQPCRVDLVVWRIWWIVALWPWRLQSVKALESGGSEHEVVGSAMGAAFALALPME